MPPPTTRASHFMFSVAAGRMGGRAVANHGERPPRRSACSVSSGSRALITILKWYAAAENRNAPITPERNSPDYVPPDRTSGLTDPEGSSQLGGAHADQTPIVWR